MHCTYWCLDSTPCVYQQMHWAACCLAWAGLWWAFFAGNGSSVKPSDADRLARSPNHVWRIRLAAVPTTLSLQTTLLPLYSCPGLQPSAASLSLQALLQGGRS